MVDAVINTIVERLAPIIEERIKYELGLVFNFKKEAETLASMLKNIKQLLDEAEKKGVIDLRVKAWLEKIEEASYEMDDALDELEMMRLGREIKASSQQQEVPSFWKNVSSFIQSLCLCPRQDAWSHSIARKIKELTGRLESIAEENDRQFKFLPNVFKSTSIQDSQDFRRDLTTSYIDESKVHGRENLKEELVSKLLSIPSQKGNHHPLKVISIVGTGGLGKTTLAQLAYNDPSVKDHFNIRIWVSVSNPFDEIRIAKAIIESVEENSPNLEEFQNLLKRVETCIAGKKFLLVLDDVWLEDEKKWTPLKRSLSNNVSGSTILVTTRKDWVAKAIGTTQFQSLQPLTDLDCWLLLRQIALKGRKEDIGRQEKIGIEIAKKCKGLPLAAVTLGSLLQKKVTMQEWENVLESEIWELEDMGVELFPHLYLSYKELSPPVMRCFSYCAIFPKSTEIYVEELIRMWMAQGFLSSGSAEDMELNGREYFEDLVASSFFQDIATHEIDGSIYACKMHDIVHDFAQYVTKNKCFIFNDDLAQNRRKASLMKTARHVTWVNKGNASTSPISSCSVEKLRSFLCQGKLPPEVLSTLQCVRVLSLDRFGLKELPSDIGNYSIHLRYLRLSGVHIRKLPRSLCDLYNLQTLDVTECESIDELPEEIYKLKNLRHLLYCYGGTLLPPGVGEITGLRTLNFFNSQRGRNKLGYLKDLNQLQGELYLRVDNLNEESDGIEAQNAQLEKKTHLRHLWLSFVGATRMAVVEALRPPPNLIRLVLEGCIHFPEWMGIERLSNLKSLIISRCSNLPSSLWNLQSLEELQIWDSSSMKCLVSNEFLGITDVTPQDRRRVAFPKLKMLKFCDCKEWIEWEDISEEFQEQEDVSIMPSLTTLHVTGCRELKSLPHLLLNKIPHLESLNISESYLLIEEYRSNWNSRKLSPQPEIEDWE